MTRQADFDAVIVGGGFYGARLALMLRATGRHVLLVEREQQLLGRASLRNQARVHNGYHYPRSLLTSLRSRLNYARFLTEFEDCIDRSFPHYYAIGRGTSKISASQFVAFCRRIGAPVAPAPDAVARLFDRTRIESVFTVDECAFDAAKLRARMESTLDRTGVVVRLGTTAVRVSTDGPAGSPMSIDLLDTTASDGRADSGRGESVTANLVLNCTYSGINRLLSDSQATVIPAKHELTEMALIEPPSQLNGAAVTVMDGPFFSMMPYPSRGLFTLSHVRYTPHFSWYDRPGELVALKPPDFSQHQSRFLHMVRDAERYLPAMRSCRQVDSLWEIKTVMPRSEQDDSRPILLQRSAELPSLLTILGAKIDSVYDVEDALAEQLALRPAARKLTPRAGVGVIV